MIGELKMKRVNINVILCDRVNESLTDITNIVDVIKADDENKISFDVAVFINGIEWNVKKFGLYFFLEKVDSQKITYLGSLEFQLNEERKKHSNGNFEIGTHLNCSQSISRMEFKDINILGEGAYELQAYKYEDDKMVDLSNKSLEDCIGYAQDDNLVSVYAFEVVH